VTRCEKFKKIFLGILLLLAVCSAALALAADPVVVPDGLKSAAPPKIDGFFDIPWGTKWNGMKSVERIKRKGYTWCNQSYFRGSFAGDAQADIALYFTSDNKFYCGKAHCFWGAADLKDRYVQIFNGLEKKYGPPQDDWSLKDFDYQSHGKHWLGTFRGDAVHITCTLTIEQNNQPKCIFLQYWDQSLYDRQPTGL
jgi:hypothetical protein